MPTIRIVRTDEYINLYRDYGIYIDGVKQATIANKKAIAIEVAPGMHTLTAKIDWTSSPMRTFTISVAETITFKVGGFKGARWMVPLMVILSIAGPVVDAWLHFEHLYSLSLLPFALVLIYYITVGRKQYLSLTQVPATMQRVNNITSAQTAY